MKSKALAFLASALMLLSAASCGEGESSSRAESSLADSSSAAETSEAESVPSEADSSDAETSEAEAETVFPPMEAPVKELSCLKADGRVSEMSFSSDNKLVISCTSLKGKAFYIADPKEDKLIRSFEPASEIETLLGLRPDGTVITIDSVEGKISFYAPDSGAPRVLDYPPKSMYCKYDPAADLLYGYDRNIVSIDMQTGEFSETVPIDELSDSILAVDAGRGIFAADRRSAENNGCLKPELFSLSDSRSIAQLNIRNCDSLFLTKSYAAAESFGDNDDSSGHTVTLFDLADGSSVKTLSVPEISGMYFTSQYSDHILATASNTGGSDWETYLKVLDLANAETAEIHFENSRLYGCSACALPCGRWFFAASPGDEETQYTVLLMLDPALASENRHPADVTALPDSEGLPHHEPDGCFSEQRAKADRLEEKYGVKIYIAEEVLDMPENKEYDLDPMTRENSDPIDMNQSLNKLDQMLSRFPKEFLRRFVTPAGGGLRLAVVSDLVSRDGSREFRAAGVTWETGAWVNIAYCDAEAFYYDGILIHEMWHAVEFLVDRKYPMDEDKWALLLPEGFNYSYDSEGFITGSLASGNTIGSEEKKEDIYFVNDYGKVSPFEDRATVIEQYMQEDVLEPEQRVSAYPRLKAKAEFLAEWIKPYFGYVYFEKQQTEAAA